jgi:anti-sigma B factor antagonist
MALKITVRDVDGVSVVALEGRIGVVEEADSLRRHVKELLTGGKKKLVLNMGAVGMMGSTGVGALVSLHHSAVATGASLRLCNLTSMLSQVLQITCLLTIFNISPTEDDAVQALSQSA